MSSLLPFIEQATVYDQVDFSRSTNQAPNFTVYNGLLIGSLICPSDPWGGLLVNDRHNNTDWCGPCNGGKTMGQN